ncbi:Conserved_hypothetical protein [Hexamita inflata]|uniref:Uncharacterized protein n=1 Tax=Hexamita inflata TaxID=28002 RepID=A0ABP1HEV7_9EUKA
MSKIVSEAMLKEYLKIDNLQSVTELDMVVNTTEQSLNALVRFLPNLQFLNLSNSTIEISDIPAFEKLQTLMLKNCQIQSLEGLFNFLNLKKLILSNNQISQLDSLLDLSLEELDLSYNKISNQSELNYITHMTELKSIVLIGNPLDYKSFIEQKFPEIEIDRADYALDIRANELENTQSINGGDELKKTNQRKSIYLVGAKDLYCSPYSILKHKQSFK